MGDRVPRSLRIAFVAALLAGVIPTTARAAAPEIATEPAGPAVAALPTAQTAQTASSPAAIIRDPAAHVPGPDGIARPSTDPPTRLDLTGESPATATSRAADQTASARPAGPATPGSEAGTADPAATTWPVQGSVHFSDGTVPADAVAVVKLDATHTWTSPVNGTTGDYSVPVVDGSYRVGVLLSDFDEAYWYTSSAAVPVSSLGDAVTVAGAGVTGIDLTVPASRTVSGTVAWGASPASSGSVTIYDRYGNQAAQVAISGGTFSAVVRPGKYLIAASSGSASYGAAWYKTGGYAISSADATLVTVGVSDVTGRAISLPPLQTLTGQVTGGGTGVSNVYVEAWTDGVFWDDATTDATGHYTVKIPPGDLEVWFFDRNIAYAPGWWAGGTALTANPQNDHHTTVTSSTGTVTVGPAMTAARYISGVLSGQGAVAGASVEAMTAGSSASVGWTDSAGRYSIPVLVGSYAVHEPGGHVGANSLAAGWYGSGGFSLDAASAVSVAVSVDFSGADMSIPTTSTLFGWVVNEDGLGLNAIVDAYHSGAVYASAFSRWPSGYYHLDLASTATFQIAFTEPTHVYGSGWYGGSGLVRSQSQAAAVVPGGQLADVVLPYLTLPGKPTVAAAAAFSGGAVVTWNAPASDGGADITKYTVTSSPGGRTCTTTGARRCLVTGLMNGTAYTFTVTATTVVGTGAPSDPSAAVTPTPVPGPPGSVTAIASNSSAIVSWAAPSVTGGSSITGYTVTASPGGKTCTTTGALTCRVTQLANGTSYTFTVKATNSYGTGPASEPSSAVKPVTSSTFHTMTPHRFLDTRVGNGLGGKFYANQPRSWLVAGRNGVPTNATAVTGNVTVVNSTAGWAIYLGPADNPSPSSSTINFGRGQIVANGVTVALSPTGKLSATFISSGSNSTDLVFDVTGYFTPDLTGATYHPMSPARLLDTRLAGSGGKLSANAPREIPIRGLKGVGSEAVAVTGNVTSVNSTSAWAIYVGPTALSKPTTSSVNFTAGQIVANNLTVSLSAAGSLWATFMSNGGTTDLVFDVTGYYTADDTGTSFIPLTPARLLDTRVGNGHSGKLAAKSPISFAVTGRDGVPLSAVGVTGNVTVTDETFAWAVYVGPDSSASPSTSTINFVKGDIKANGLTVALTGSGSLYATYLSNPPNTTSLVFDVTGYFIR
jgi:hypothetical protein